jgi:hypothetical protein
MDVEQISRGTRKTRKPHQCFDCYTIIPAGTEVAFFTGKMDGRAYTLYFHQDCQAASDHYRASIPWSDYWDGVPPLMDGINDSSEGDMIRNQLRGHFPHVVCRLEFHEQKAGLRFGDTPQT